MEQIRTSENEVKLVSVDDEGVIQYDTLGLWKCRKCGETFQSFVSPPVSCECCMKGKRFDAVSPPIVKELWRPYSEPIIFGELDGLYENIAGFIQDHVVLRDMQEVEIMALWIIASYKQGCFDTAPYLQFLGAIESGKTRALEVLSMLCYRAVNLISISPAALCRLIERYTPTVLLDQAEQKFNLKSERGCEMYDIFMSGYKKGQRYIVASKEDESSIVSRDVFGFKAVASTRVFDHAFASRSIQFKMKQGSPKVKEISKESRDEAQRLRSMLLYYRLRKEPLPELDIPLIGRRRELYLPLFVVGDKFNITPDDVKELLVEDKKKMDSEMSDTTEADILREIKIVFHGIDEQERIRVSDIAQRLEIPARSLGYRLKAMNIDRKHGHDGAYIDLTDGKTTDELNYLFSKYHVEV